MAWRDHDLTALETYELIRLLGILKCDQMLFVTGQETAEKIAALEAEIERRDQEAAA